MTDPGPPESPGAASTRPPVLRAVASLVIVIVVLAIVAGTVMGLRANNSGSSNGGPPGSLVKLAAGPSPSIVPTTPDVQAARKAGLADLLRRRERAVLDHDETSWLATIDPRQTVFRAAQAAVFANLEKLPITAWQYSDAGPALPLTSQRQSALGADAWATNVELGYRFGAADRTDVQSAETWTVVQRAGVWLLAGDSDGPADPEIWDLGPLTVLTGVHSVVIGMGSTASLKGYVSQADSAVERVSAIWGSDWPRRVVVIVPRTQAQVGRLLGRSSASMSQIAAVTTGELSADTGRPAGGADQIVVNPAGFAQLDALGRRVVITHETTHVAVRASTPRGVSIWLSEGFADYIGFSGVHLARTDVAADVLGEVRRGTGPTHLPDTADFDATTTTIGPAYSASWLACELIADRYGQARLIELYRVAAGARPANGVTSEESPDEATSSAFRAVLGGSEAGFTRSWLSYLTSLARQ